MRKTIILDMTGVVYSRGSKRNVEFLPQFIDNKGKIFSTENNIVIASRLGVKHSKQILEKFFHNYDVSKKLEDVHIHNFREFGSKHEPKDWEKLLKMYPDADLVVDDDFADIAQVAVDNLGYDTICCSEIKSKFL